MPIPLLLGIGAAVVGIAGIGGHLSAQETNEKAEKLYKQAKNLYETSKDELEQNYKITQNILEEFKSSKEETRKILLRFIESWKKIKDARFTSAEQIQILNEDILKNSNLNIKNLNKDIYDIIDMGVIAGAGGAAYVLGGFALPVVAAPVVFISAFFADSKADENYRKAQEKYYEVELAVEKMNLQIDLYKKINLKTKLFIKLLKELTTLLLECTVLLENLIRNTDEYLLKNKKFDNEEMNLLAFSRALSQTVKTALDTPILDKNGNIALEIGKYENLRLRTEKHKQEIKQLFQR